MALTYSTFVSQIATITAISSDILVNGDANFQGIMPMIIDQAEGMLWRDLDVPAVHDETSVFCSSGNNVVNLGYGFFTGNLLRTIEDVNLVLPNGTLAPVIPTSIAFLNAVYTSLASSYCGQPQYFARFNDVSFFIRPAPDLAYLMVFQGTARPAALSSSNSSTWLTANVPEMMIAAGMIAAAGYMRDFGAQSDNPQMAVSWRTQYDYLLRSASAESLGMRFRAEKWTSEKPSPLAPRT
jgi:hypothetical protein